MRDTRNKLVLIRKEAKLSEIKSFLRLNTLENNQNMDTSLEL